MKRIRKRYAAVCENRTKILMDKKGYAEWRTLDKIGDARIATWRSVKTAMNCLQARSNWHWELKDKDIEFVEVTETIDIGLDNE